MLEPKKKIKKYIAAVIVLLILGVSVSGLRIQSVKHYKEEQRRLANDIIVAESDTSAAVVVAQEEDEDAIDGNTTEAGLTSAFPAMNSAEETSGSGEASEASSFPQVTGAPKNSYSLHDTGDKKSPKAQGKKGKRRNSAKSPAPSKQTTVSSERENNGTENSQKEYPKNPQKTPAVHTKATQKPSLTPMEEKKNFVCGITIRCDSILKHMDEVEDGVKAYIPTDGIILGQTSVKVETGDTAYSLLQKVCQAKDIALDTSYTNAYSSAYVRGIGHIYEKQAGLGSGWLYLVNGKLPGYGASRYQLKEGDQIEWVYSCTGKLE